MAHIRSFEVLPPVVTSLVCSAIIIIIRQQSQLHFPLRNRRCAAPPSIGRAAIKVKGGGDGFEKLIVARGGAAVAKTAEMGVVFREACTCDVNTIMAQIMS